MREVGQTEYLLDSDVPALSPVITPHLSAGAFHHPTSIYASCDTVMSAGRGNYHAVITKMTVKNSG